MKLSTKGRYAVMAMVDLAAQKSERPISLAEIAEAIYRHAVASFPEEACGLLGVLEEHLVEVAETEEEDRVGVGCLEAVVLPHHR